MKSAPGKGSTFMVTLPLPEAGAALLHEDKPSVTVGPTQSRALHVLVVDDHPANRKLLQLQLEALGCSASAFEDCFAAIAAFNSQNFDLILTDLNMPGMDGFAFSRYLRNRGVTTPIIAVTAHTSERDRSRSKEAGINSILIKPVLLEALRTRLAELGKDSPLQQSDRGQWDIARGALPPEVYAPLLGSLEESVIAIKQSLQCLPANNISTTTNDPRADAIGKHLHSLRGAFAFIHEAAIAQRCAVMERLLEQGSMDQLEQSLLELDAAAHAALVRRRQ